VTGEIVGDDVYCISECIYVTIIEHDTMTVTDAFTLHEDGDIDEVIGLYIESGVIPMDVPVEDDSFCEHVYSFTYAFDYGKYYLD
jgi:hypothetical protein